MGEEAYVAFKKLDLGDIIGATGTMYRTKSGEVTVRVAPRRFTVCNSGAGGPLDAGRIFDRFYQGTKKEGSTGLGLAVVDAVCRLYGLKVSYSYKEGRHCFAVDFPA